jgi:hypothetical protein
MGETCRSIGEKKNTYKVVVGKSEASRASGNLGVGGEDNIKMDIKEIRCKGADWIQVAQDRLQWRAVVNMIMNVQVP